MNCNKILFFIVIAVSVESVQASYSKVGLMLAARSSKVFAARSSSSLARVVSTAKDIVTKTKDLATQTTDRIFEQAKYYRYEFKGNPVENGSATGQAVGGNNFIPPNIGQAVKFEGESGAKSWSLLNTGATNGASNVHNHYYAKQAWHQTFAAWVKDGKQTRAAGTGFVGGLVGGYVLHPLITKKQEKIIVVQAQLEKNQ
jgi:hypothetical protein